MKRAKLFGIPALAAIGAFIAPVVASGPVGAAITTTTTVKTANGVEQFSVANVPPKIWIAKGLNKLPGDSGGGSTALDSNTVTPYSYYNFEVLAEDDNTLWNARIIICFHNTSHAVSYPGTAYSANNGNSGVAFSGTSNSLGQTYQDCVTGTDASGPLDLRNPNDHGGTDGGLNDANPDGAVPDDASTSQGESWRKARWVLKQHNDPSLSNGVDPTKSDIINDTTNNGTWRLGPALDNDPGNSSNASCSHATRTVGGVAMTTRWDSTLVHLKCSVRIGTLARATAGGAAADWDLAVAVVDGGNANNTTITDDSYMDQATHGNQFAICSAGYGGAYFNDDTIPGLPGWAGYDSCNTDGYTPPGQVKVATNLSIGSIDGHDFGTLLPPKQQIGSTGQNLDTDLASSSGTDTNPQAGASYTNYSADHTVDHCKREQTSSGDTAAPTNDNATWYTCAYVSHKVDNLVANTDHWKFQTKTTAAGGDNSPECNTSGDTKIAPALGYSGGTDGGGRAAPSYTCWYATTNPNFAGSDDTARSQHQTYAVALYEPGGDNNGSAEWDPTTMQANQFAFRCMAFPRDALESVSVTREVDLPTQAAATATAANARVYVGKNFADVPLFEYGSGTNHVIDQVSGASNKPGTNVATFDGMGSDNTSGDTTRIWRRLDANATDYEAYLHCRLDTSYVRAGTYTGIVYLAITSA